MKYSDLFNENAKMQEQFLRMSEHAADTGMRASSNQTAQVKQRLEEKKGNRKTAAQIFDDLLERLTQAQQTLDDLFPTINRALSYAEQYLNKLKDQLENRLALQDAKRTLDEGGVLARDEDGNLLDPHVQALVSRWVRNNKDSKIDVNDDAFVLVLLKDELENSPTESALRHSIDIQNKAVETLKGCETKRQELVQTGKTIKDKPQEEQELFLTETNQVKQLSNELHDINEMAAQGLISREEADLRTQNTLKKYDDKTVWDWEASQNENNEASKSAGNNDFKNSRSSSGSTTLADMFKKPDDNGTLAQNTNNTFTPS